MSITDNQTMSKFINAICLFECFLLKNAFLTAFVLLDAYTSSEILFTWRKGLIASVDCPPESISLLQYDLVGQTLSSEIFKSNTGNARCQLSHCSPHVDLATVRTRLSDLIQKKKKNSSKEMSNEPPEWSGIMRTVCL